MSSIGKIDEFKPEGESITTYLERMELFFTTNNIEDGKKVIVFLSVIGANAYTLLQDLVALAKPFEQLTEVLKKHYELTRIVIAK